MIKIETWNFDPMISTGSSCWEPRLAGRHMRLLGRLSETRCDFEMADELAPELDPTTVVALDSRLRLRWRIAWLAKDQFDEALVRLAQLGRLGVGGRNDGDDPRRLIESRGGG
jgi:hypothetical protein